MVVAGIKLIKLPNLEASRNKSLPLV